MPILYGPYALAKEQRHPLLRCLYQRPNGTDAIWALNIKILSRLTRTLKMQVPERNGMDVTPLWDKPRR